MTLTGTDARRRRRRGALDKQEARAGFAMVSPTVVVIIVAVVLPVLWTVMLSFQKIRLINLRYAGVFGSYSLDNFRQVFTAPGFTQSLLTTLAYTVGGTVLSIGVGLIAALVVRTPFRGRGFVRASMLLPYIAPVVAVTFTWEIMLNAQFGIVNQVGTKVLGWHHPIPFLSEQSGQLTLGGVHLTVPTALLTVIFFETWRYFPFAFLFILARLQAIPAELDEAARVDGATVTALPAYRATPAQRGVRGPRGAAVHLDVQQVRRHLPAHGRRLGHRRGERTRLSDPHQRGQHRAGGRAGDDSRGHPGHLPGGVLPGLRPVHKGGGKRMSQATSTTPVTPR